MHSPGGSTSDENRATSNEERDEEERQKTQKTATGTQNQVQSCSQADRWVTVPDSDDNDIGSQWVGLKLNAMVQPKQ